MYRPWLPAHRRYRGDASQAREEERRVMNGRLADSQTHSLRQTTARPRQEGFRSDNGRTPIMTSTSATAQVAYPSGPLLSSYIPTSIRPNGLSNMSTARPKKRSSDGDNRANSSTPSTPAKRSRPLAERSGNMDRSARRDRSESTGLGYSSASQDIISLLSDDESQLPQSNDMRENASQEIISLLSDDESELPQSSNMNESSQTSLVSEQDTASSIDPSLDIYDGSSEDRNSRSSDFDESEDEDRSSSLFDESEDDEWFSNHEDESDLKYSSSKFDWGKYWRRHWREYRRNWALTDSEEDSDRDGSDRGHFSGGDYDDNRLEPRRWREDDPSKLHAETHGATRDIDISRIDNKLKNFMDFSVSQFQTKSKTRGRPKIYKKGIPRLRDIAFNAVATHSTSLTPALLQCVGFEPLGHLLFDTLLKSQRISLRLYKTFVDVYSAELANRGAAYKRRLSGKADQKAYNRYNRQFHWNSIPGNLTKELEGSLKWLVYLELSDTAANASESLLSIVHIPMLAALQLTVRPRTATKSSPWSVLNDRMLKSFATSMELDNKWQFLRVLIIDVIGGGGQSPRAITRDGLRSILSVPNRIRYLECAKSCIPVVVCREPVIPQDPAQFSSKAGAPLGWTRIKTFRTEDPKTCSLPLKYNRVLQIIDEKSLQLPDLSLCFAEEESAHSKSADEILGSKDSQDSHYILDGIILRRDNRMQKQQTTPQPELERRKRESIIRKGVTVRHRVDMNSLLDL
ncbi:hypothetical protein BZA70DRAFT_309066 [Myxozyma melibiosi]|uniref:Meiotically up-regulated protein Msb1/Mug8 domain-containing protein n=1 Tax=Myxozyma melibiosi TaxID=54550 RepID=A0ABR1FES7_9ASCO